MTAQRKDYVEVDREEQRRVETHRAHRGVGLARDERAARLENAVAGAHFHARVGVGAVFLDAEDAEEGGEEAVGRGGERGEEGQLEEREEADVEEDEEAKQADAGALGLVEEARLDATERAARSDTGGGARQRSSRRR